MTQTAIRELQTRVGCPVEFDRPLTPYTTYRIGGPATAIVNARSARDVAAALRFAAESGARWLVLGLGSNVLISDHGFDGIVVRLAQGLRRIVRGVGGDKTVWAVGAGVPTPILARRTAKAGLAGIQRLVGVPGTVGGGVFMNAGAHGQDLSQVARTVDVVDDRCEVRSVPASQVAWRYRGSGLDGAIVVGATLRFSRGDPAELLDDIRQHFRWRRAGTPFTEACCGSVFRNPAPPPCREAEGAEGAEGAGGRTAGRLIDACGLKGFRIGGAQVSHKHANYIVNTGGATADDVLGVIEAVRKRVNKEFGLELQLEVKIVK